MIADALKSLALRGLWLLLGRRNLVRLSRFLTNGSRLDVKNEMARNGESLVQRAVLAAPRGDGGPVVFDVGAHVGGWTRLLFEEGRRIGADPVVHAFEPCPGTSRLLRANLRAWGLESRVRVSGLALSSAPGRLTFHSLGDGMGRNGLHPPEGAATSTLEVEAETVDRYCRDRAVPRIDLLKIDAEGHDLEVLAGAAGMIRESRVEAVQFEYNVRWIAARRFLRDAFELLLPLGCAVGKVTPGGIEFYRAWDAELETFREANFLAVPAARASRFQRVRWWKEEA